MKKFKLLLLTGLLSALTASRVFASQYPESYWWSWSRANFHTSVNKNGAKVYYIPTKTFTGNIYTEAMKLSNGFDLKNKPYFSFTDIYTYPSRGAYYVERDYWGGQNGEGQDWCYDYRGKQMIQCGQYVFALDTYALPNLGRQYLKIPNLQTFYNSGAAPGLWIIDGKWAGTWVAFSERNIGNSGTEHTWHHVETTISHNPEGGYSSNDTHHWHKCGATLDKEVKAA